MSFLKTLFDGGKETSQPMQTRAPEEMRREAGRITAEIENIQRQAEARRFKAKAETFAVRYRTQFPVGGSQGGENATRAVRSLMMRYPGRFIEKETAIMACTDADQTMVTVVYLTDDKENPLGFGKEIELFLSKHLEC
jgi:hypothetical protein